MGNRKNRNVYRLWARRSYSISEIADLLGAHVRTIQAWHREGMRAIDEMSKPFLFTGEEIKRYLTEKARARKIKLKDSEFYCLRCRAARTSAPENMSVINTGKRIGKDDEFVMIKGKCGICGSSLTRFSTQSAARSPFLVRKSKRRGRILTGDLFLPLNADIGGFEVDEK